MRREPVARIVRPRLWPRIVKVKVVWPPEVMEVMWISTSWSLKLVSIFAVRMWRVVELEDERSTMRREKWGWEG